MGFLARTHEARAVWTGPHKLTEADYIRQVFQAGTDTQSGIVVTYEMAFTFSAVYDAVNQISSDVAKMPLNHMRRRADGGAEVYSDSKLYRILKFEPNTEMGSMVFRRTLLAHALTSHGGYAEIVRNGLGQVTALWPIPPHRIKPKRDEIRGPNGAVRLGPLYYDVDNGTTRLAPENVLHIRGLGYDANFGYSVLDKAREAIGLALAAEQFGASFFGNGTAFGGAMTVPPEITDEDTFQAIRERLQANHQGPDNAHRYLLLTNGLTFTPFGTEPDKAQMDQLRNKQVEEVARFYRMPPYRLGVNTPGTVSYASVEMANLDYYSGCLLDWVTIWEEEINRKLIPALEARQQFVKHNANVFLRADIKSRYEALGIARDKGIINGDEWRELEDMNPMPNGQGKLYLVQQAQIPLDRIADLTDATIKEKSTPKQPASVPNQTPDPASQRILELIESRLHAAEQAAAEARASAEAEMAARIAAETRADVTAQEIAGYKAREEAAGVLASRMEALEASLSSELAQAREQIQRAQDAERDIRTQLETAIQAREAAERRIAAQDQAVADAQAAVVDQQRKAEEAAAVAGSAIADRAAAEAARDEARLAAEQAAAELRAALEARATAQAELAQAQANEQAAREQRDSAQASLVAESERREAEQKQAQRDLAKMDLDVFNAERLKSEAENRATSIETARTQAEQALKAAKQADADANSAQIAAHRALIVHVMRGAIERETDRARRHQQTPDKLRTWLETWYDNHGELMRAALLPAMTVHLTFVRSTESAGEVVARIVAEHIAESQRQITAVIDGDAGALAQNLAQLLTRWEAERVTMLADRLMQKELEYVAQRHAA